MVNILLQRNKNVSTGAVASLVWFVVSWKLLLLLVKRLLQKTFGGNGMGHQLRAQLWVIGHMINCQLTGPTHSVDWGILFFSFSMIWRGGGNTNAILCYVLFDRSQSARNEGYVLIQSTKYLVIVYLLVYTIRVRSLVYCILLCLLFAAALSVSDQSTVYWHAIA